MKGVILGICPAARLVDLTHAIPAHDVAAGQLALEAAVPFFPAGTVHLAVVDPGVGGARRPLLLSALGQHFVGPDNGLFTFALRERGGWSAVALEAAELRLPSVSRTFHGRDVFAPAAAHVARGVEPFRFGPAVLDPVRAPLPTAWVEGDALVGEVVASDHFGNLVTSIVSADLDRLPGPGQLEVMVGGTDVGAPMEFYGAGDPGRLAAIVGSSGRLELFVREGSAAAPGLGRGTRVRVVRRRATGA